MVHGGGGGVHDDVRVDQIAKPFGKRSKKKENVLCSCSHLDDL